MMKTEKEFLQEQLKIAWDALGDIVQHPGDLEFGPVKRVARDALERLNNNVVERIEITSPRSLKQNLLYEDMIRVETETDVCRIWRGYNYNNEELRRQALALMSRAELTYNIVSQLVRYEGVSAVEMVDRKTGCGICVYRDWP